MTIKIEVVGLGEQKYMLIMLNDLLLISLQYTQYMHSICQLARFAGKLNDKDFKMPSNVKFISWLPQNDLLAHNKTKLFITHGGMYGKVEFSGILRHFSSKIYFHNFFDNLH